jgi:hypothetical protein
MQNDGSDQVNEKNSMIKELQNQIKRLHEVQGDIQSQLDHANLTVIPQLKDHSKYHKDRMVQEFE